MDGRLGAEKVQVRKFVLEIGGVLIEFWGEEPSNRLMLITVPVQGLSMAREGFELLSPPPPGGGAKPGIVERPVSFSSGGLEMPGTLCLPESRSARLPIVILVHGSGPNDRDETIGPNKPFRDLAHGLAAGGIASLRYDKRTFAFRGQMNPRTVTLDQEVIDDAVAALKYGASLPEADPSRVFLLGHSMGGSLAPLIAERSGLALRGVALMAAAARPLDEIVAEQVAFQMKVAGVAEAEIAGKTAELKSAFARVRSGQAPEDEVVLFAPARYWRELFRLDIGAAVSRLQAPVLVLQGGRDIQIGRRDYDLIQKALASVPDDRKEFRWFEGLNHLFMEVTGESTGSEYGRTGQVHPEVIGTIMAWIRRRA
jgi:hypothetical protein